MAIAAWALPLLILVSSAAVKADQSGDFTFTSDGAAITITGYTGAGGAVTIPSTITSLPVTGIQKYAFSDCPGASVSIPSSITSIGDYAFSFCTVLTSIAVDTANPNYSSLDGVLFNKALTELIQYPGGKSGTYTIPASVTSIGNSAFSQCSGLTKVNIPASVTSIESKAFSGCTGLTSVNIPDNVTSIGDYAFNFCSGLTSVTIPLSVVNLGEAAFQHCSRLMSVSLPIGITSIGPQTFEYCVGLTGVTIPESVTSLGEEVFGGCSGLASMTIPESVTSIGRYAFYGCTALTSARIPANVTSIDGVIFKGCTGLTNVSVDAGNPVYNSVEGVLFNKTTNTLVECLEAKTGDYRIPAGVTSIGIGAFYDCSGLTSVTIPESVTSIGYSGHSPFIGCARLTNISVNAGNTVYKSVDGVLFQWSNWLIGYPAAKSGSYSIPIYVSRIGSYAFYGCVGLTSITIPAGMRVIFYNAFSGCTGLKSVVIPEGVEAVLSGAFSDCTGLTSVTIPAGVTRIDSVFDGCAGLTSVTIPASVTSIEWGAFYECSGLKSAVFLGNAPAMGGSVFSYTSTDFTVYFLSGATGFTTPTWMGYRSVNMGAATPVTSWLVSNGVAYNADLQSDPNKDGVPLAVEYGLGLNPGVFNANPATSKVESNRLALEFSIPEVIPAGVRIYIEESTGLSGWQVIASKISGEAWTMAGGATAGEGAMISGRFPVTVRSGHLLSDSAMRFMRLGVEVSGTSSPNPDADSDGLPDSWETTQFGNSSSYRANDDPNHDGLALALEYVLALDTHSQNQPVIHSTGEAERLGVVFSIPAALPTGSRIYIEESTGLSGWQQIASKTSGGAWTTADGANVSEGVAVSGRIPVTVRSGHARSESSGRFMRLGVELPTSTAP